MDIFERIESEVRGYCRSFPTVFTTAKGAVLRDENDREYLDFFAGAGTLNYGHNNPILKEQVLEYIKEDGLLHGLDMATEAKRSLLEAFDRNIRWARKYEYKLQFPGPTGTNAVEAALKLARKVTGRSNIISFTNGFHGVSLGSLAMTANQHFRDGAGVDLANSSFMPYDGYLGPDLDTVEYLRRFIEDKSSGIDLPAAVIVETVQGEGGLNCASFEWLQCLEKLCREYDILMIVDDIQVGCGRTGTFFSFEEAGIKPDIVTLSKSLSGYGLPMSVLLMRAEHDIWKPGEHNGTFRGNNLAFVSATAALNHYWRGTSFTRSIQERSQILRNRLEDMCGRLLTDDETSCEVRGRGMAQGIAFTETPELAQKICKAAFERGLILETSGAEGQVIKCLAPLTIELGELEAGLDILKESIETVAGKRKRTLGTASGTLV